MFVVSFFIVKLSSSGIGRDGSGGNFGSNGNRKLSCSLTEEEELEQQLQIKVTDRLQESIIENHNEKKIAAS
jgi:hypothetical protein